jgi:hypothetical protein
VFAAQANTKHAVFLQEVWRWSVHNELIREAAHACELESLDTEKHWLWWREANYIIVQCGQKTFAV